MPEWQGALNPCQFLHIVPCFKHDLVLWLSKHSVSATTSASFSRLLKCPLLLSVHTWTVAPFKRSRGYCDWFDRHKKCVGEASLHLQLDLNTLGFLNVPSGENQKVNELLGCELKTESLQTYVGMKCLLV